MRPTVARSYKMALRDLNDVRFREPKCVWKNGDTWWARDPDVQMDGVGYSQVDAQTHAQGGACYYRAALQVFGEVYADHFRREWNRTVRCGLEAIKDIKP